MPSLYPVILSEKISEVAQQLDIVKNLPTVDVVQIDIIDGFFVPNLTILPEQLLDLDYGDLQIDLHLMVDEPIDTVVYLMALKNQLPIRAIIAQLEHMSYQLDFCEQVKQAGWQAGLSLDSSTPFSSIDEEVLSKLKIIQCLGVNAGYQGQSFNELTLVKVNQIAKKWLSLAKDQHLERELLVDGGVKLTNAHKIIEAGANGLVVGSELWQATNIQLVAEEFNQLLKD